MARYGDLDLLLENLKKQYGEELGWQCTVNMSDVGMMIEDAPAVEWISVEERLPEKDGLYIIVGRSGTPHAAHYYTGKRGFSNPYATHWMPMPEPPPKEG